MFQGKHGVLLSGVETDLRTLDILLPVGVSFYTFQTMSYTIDIYRDRLREFAAQRGHLRRAPGLDRAAQCRHAARAAPAVAVVVEGKG